MARHKVYYKGVVVSLVNPCLPHGLSVHQKCSNYALTNLLFSFYRFVWIIDLLVILLSPHPGAPKCPSTPKVLWAKDCAPTPSLFVVFTFGFAVESMKEFGGASLEEFLMLCSMLWTSCFSFLSIKIYVCTWLDFLIVNMVSKLRLFDEKVERDLELESL